MCVLLVTWRANGIVLYMYEGKVLMDNAFKSSLYKSIFHEIDTLRFICFTGMCKILLETIKFFFFFFLG